MTILPLTYLGGTEWFARLMRDDRHRCVIDTGEKWVKQTARNHCEIMTSLGVATLTVPVHGGGGIATRDVRIDNSKRWQHVHWMALVSAYRSSPYFDHYEERFAPVYVRKFDFLTDLNLELLDITTRILGTGNSFEISDHYIEASPGDTDLRGKKALRRSDDPVPATTPRYTQVFSDRMPFTPGLSIVDLIFCEGTDAPHLLRSVG